MTSNTNGDTYITIAARHGLYVIIAVGSLLLIAATAASAVDLDRRLAIEARV